MLTLKQTDPPAHFKPGSLGEPVVGVRIVIPNHALSAYLFAAQNRIGREILGRLLLARMELAGVMVTEFHGGFELNRAFYLITVSELAPALRAVKEELEKMGLAEFLQLAWRDPREEIWRVFFSRSGRFDSPSDEELSTEKDLTAEALKRGKAFQKENEPA